VENFRCLTSYRPSAKVKNLTKLLENEKGNSLSQKLQNYYQKTQIEVQIQQIRIKLPFIFGK